jgi:hypothetical protein
MASEYTHYAAHFEGGFPLCGEITRESLLMLANGGTTVYGEPAGEVESEARRLAAHLDAGVSVRRGEVLIQPLTAADYATRS